MRILLALLMSALPCVAMGQEQSTAANRPFPENFTPLLRTLSKSEVDRMQSSANSFCLKLDYNSIDGMYANVGHCTLMQSTAIMDVDLKLSGFRDAPPSKYRPDQIRKCWSLYRALGAGDAENLSHCVSDIEYFDYLQGTSSSTETNANPVATGYCDRVAQAAGGSFMILEECMKQETASRRRLGR